MSTALAALAGAIVFMPVAAEAGPDACTTIGSISTCVGDQSDGIVSGVDFPSASTTLNVNSLASNIAPATDTNGILFVGDTTVLINSDLRKRDIILDGFAEGVIGAAPGDVTINHNGDIFGGFRGINGDSAGGKVDAESHVHRCVAGIH
ncbi:MAG: hypothetical protein MUE79_02065 [Nitratireductor sp.]|nr:hypothetical protein [Nitratireductor sp.]